MLYIYEDHLVDIVREKPYSNLVTVLVTNPESLKAFGKFSPVRPTAISHYLYRGAIHLSEDRLPLILTREQLDEIEEVDRITPEPIAFLFEYEVSAESGVSRKRGYCWADDQVAQYQLLLDQTTNLLSDVTFYPLFRIPTALLGSTTKSEIGKADPETND
jgi:hypothetical protein